MHQATPFIIVIVEEDDRHQTARRPVNALAGEARPDIARAQDGNAPAGFVWTHGAMQGDAFAINTERDSKPADNAQGENEVHQEHAARQDVD